MKKWAPAIVLAALLAVTAAIGFNTEPLVGLAAIVALVGLGAYVLAKLTEQGIGRQGGPRRRRRSRRRKRYY